MLATMHGKQRVIAPVLEQGLGLKVMLPAGLDTDRFGTFSREVARTGSPLDTARAKIAAAFDCVPRARFGVASEGSFGPDPFLPMLPLATELVLLVDRESGFELTGQDLSRDTNYRHAIVPDVGAALAFALRIGFPAHGLIVIGCDEGKPTPGRALIKDIPDHGALEQAVQRVIAMCGAALVETDMRADRNPTRMAAIERAARDLVRRFRARCPHCACPGFDVTERVAGLPCSSCGAPTRVISSEVLTCRSCGHRTERAATPEVTADPGRCDWCNP